MKMKVDLSGSDPEKATGGAYETPKPGVYTAVIDDVTAKKSKSGSPMLEVVIKIIGPNSKGAKVWDYILTEQENTMWKLDQFLQALGKATKSKRKFTLDTDDIIGDRVKVRIKNETYNDEPQAKIGAYLLASEDEDDLDEESEDNDDLEEDDDLEEEEVEEEEEDPEDESEEDEDEGEEEEEEEEETDDEYESMSVTALRKECEERDLLTKGAKPALIARLRKNDEEPF